MSNSPAFLVPFSDPSHPLHSVAPEDRTAAIWQQIEHEIAEFQRCRQRLDRLTREIVQDLKTNNPGQLGTYRERLRSALAAM